MALGKFPEAIYDFTWALKLGNEQRAAANDKGNEQKTTIDNTSLSKYNRFAGNCYFEMAQYQEAKTHYLQALKNNKDESGLNYFNMGLVLSKLGDLVPSNKNFN